MRQVLVVNGPNLNLLGTRRPDVYGQESLSDLDRLCRDWGAELGLEVATFQSNHEGVLIDRLHQARSEGCDGIVFNAGAYTHTSFALHDAVEAIEIPTVEVHISNVKEREEWRRTSRIAPACVYTIYGRGIEGYRWALRHLWYRSKQAFETIQYADGTENQGDLRRPDGEPVAACLLVHGGFWLPMWTRDIMDGLAVDLCRRGLVTLNVEYGRTRAGGGWPQSMNDVTTAARWLAGEAGGQQILLGHSAGGQLALMSASQTNVDLVVSLAGVLDMEATAAGGPGAGPARDFLNGVDPKVVSPMTAPPIRSPVLVTHGDRDDLVPVTQSRAYARRINDAGGRVEYLELAGEGHFSLLDPDSNAWQLVVEALWKLLGEFGLPSSARPG